MGLQAAGRQRPRGVQVLGQQVEVVPGLLGGRTARALLKDLLPDVPCAVEVFVFVP
jgi:hypothetical protein